jgi:glycosyltransferase involved in cell wall biosynthesis
MLSWPKEHKLGVRTVFSYPGNMADAQNSARALMESGVLDAFVTSFAYRKDGWIASLLGHLPSPITEPLGRQLARRSIDQVHAGLVHAYPLWELARTAAMHIARGPIAADMVWDHRSHRFDRLVARRYVAQTQAIHAYEYTALCAFQRAKQEGVARILHLPSLDSRHFEEIQRREKQEWPELIAPHDAYFDARFERRYARRRAEIALADVIITNSSLTARSHIAAGADPAKVTTVPLAAPPAISSVRQIQNQTQRPLAALWAGSFSLGKGAHYALRAWRILAAGPAARLHVYGHVTVPERVRAEAGEHVVFHGSVPKPQLYAAYEAADVLVFPTLSDGFGMVVTEAMAHGLPVIATDQAGAADLITPDNGMIIPSANPRALADALRWCLDNRSRLADMRYHALETARRRQWGDFRRELIAGLDGALRKAGYSPSYRALL